MRDATKGGMRRDPPLSSAHFPCAARGWRGKPQPVSGLPQSAARGQGRGGAPPDKQRALPVHDLPEREKEGGIPHKQEGEGMALPEQHSALPAQGTREREGGHPPTWRGEKRREEGEYPDREADAGQGGWDKEEETAHRPH